MLSFSTSVYSSPRGRTLRLVFLKLSTPSSSWTLVRFDPHYLVRRTPAPFVFRRTPKSLRSIGLSPVLVHPRYRISSYEGIRCRLSASAILTPLKFSPSEASRFLCRRLSSEESPGLSGRHSWLVSACRGGCGPVSARAHVFVYVCVWP